MNYRLVSKIIAMVLLIEAAFMTVPVIIGICDKDTKAELSFIYTILIVCAVSGLLLLAAGKKEQYSDKGFYEQEGFVATGLSWIALSLTSALPFMISGEIPRFADALFETVSGFTTTGASILTNVEALSRPMLYWRSFSHWLGGMGILVFMMAVLPAVSKSKNSSDMFLLKAESPGPEVGKITPHMQSTAMILYMEYIALTILCIIFLLIGKMPFFDAVCLGFGTAGTGGFGIKGDSLASYTPFAQDVTTIFMMLFGVNFNVYFLLLLKKPKQALRNQELRWYFGFWAIATAIVYFNIVKEYGAWNVALRHAAFQTASVMTTTGYATADFDKWSMMAKAAMLILMCIGASAGSTGGGFKVSRVLLLCKTLRRSVRRALHPSRTASIHMDGRKVSEATVSNVCSYLIAYVFLIVISVLLISVDNQSVTTTITAVIACFNSIGPGFDAVGATGNYAMFSDFSKLVLIADMLLGRLEIFPLLAMLSRSAWDRRL